MKKCFENDLSAPKINVNIMNRERAKNSSGKKTGVESPLVTYLSL